MYLRCSFESKPAWNGRSRVLFQNKNNHVAEIRTRTSRSTNCGLNCFDPARQRMTHPHATAISNIQSSQIFFAFEKVLSTSAMGLPGPGVFGAEASATCLHDEPANDASHFSSVRSFSWPLVKTSQSAGGPLWLNTRTSTMLAPSCN